VDVIASPTAHQTLEEAGDEGKALGRDIVRALNGKLPVLPMVIPGDPYLRMVIDRWTIRYRLKTEEDVKSYGGQPGDAYVIRNIFRHDAIDAGIRKLAPADDE
jgi:hypothetical protein